jgi:hypothetical protein
MLGATLVFVTAALLSASLPFFPDLRGRWSTLILAVFGLVFFTPLAWLAFDAWTRRHERILTDEVEIRVVSPGGHSQAITWVDVVEARERPLLQRLELHGARGPKVLRLEYQLEGFLRLRQIIRDRALQLRTRHRQLREFHRVRYLSLVGMAGALLFLWLTWYGWQADQFSVVLTGLGFTILSAFSAVREQQRVILGTRSVTLRWPLWAREVPYTTVRDVTLQNVSDAHGNLIATVFIHRRDGKPLRVTHIREGTMVLFDALRAACESAGQALASNGLDGGSAESRM